MEQHFQGKNILLWKGIYLTIKHISWKIQTLQDQKHSATRSVSQEFAVNLSVSDYTTPTNAVTFKEVQKEAAFCGKEIAQQHTQVCKYCSSVNSIEWEGKL